ncbi:MAG: periplasmic heavy metal sensor [Desulfacinum sp.]|nr:periplasmic heavy metal sensor [Desulfacinum sp.]
MRRKRMLIVAASVVALLAVTSVGADAFGGPRFREAPPHGGPGFFHAIDRFLDLRLTPQQQERIQAVLAKYRDDMLDALKVQRESRRNLWTVMIDERADEATVRKAFKAVAAAEEELAVLGHRVRREIESILTDQQRAVMSSWHHKHRDGIAPPFPEPPGDEAPIED